MKLDDNTTQETSMNTSSLRTRSTVPAVLPVYCRKRLTSLLVTLLVTSACAASAQWKSGTALPDLKTFKLEGTLPALSGKVVVLDFWASWCGPCKASFPVLNELQNRHAKSGLVVIAINEDEKQDAMRTFLNDNSVSFAVVRDAGHKLVAAAGVESMPSSFLIDRSGKVRFVHAGFHGNKTTEQYNKEIELLLKEEPGK